jgi:hypothetical protein
VTVPTAPDAEDLGLLEDALRRTMTSTSGPELDAALVELGWHDMLAEMADAAIPLAFRLLGETGSHAAVLNDVVLHALGQPPGGTVALPYRGGNWVVWERRHEPGGHSSTTIDPELPIRRVGAGSAIPLVAARAALAWWLVGSARTMLELARQHALDRTQFGRPIASFQAVRHRLAETLVAIEGAEATLACADDDLGALMAKAAAGQAALTAAKHCQQVLGGIGFTAEHDFHRHFKRVLVLDGLLGSSRELVSSAGRTLRANGSAPRIAQL